MTRPPTSAARGLPRVSIVKSATEHAAGGEAKSFLLVTCYPLPITQKVFCHKINGGGVLRVEAGSCLKIRDG
jgi:hypothetical protein